MITMLLSLFLSTAQAQNVVPSCTSGEIPLVGNTFALGSELEGCEQAMRLFIRIENRTSFCIQPSWTSLGAKSSVVKWDNEGDAVPVVIMDQNGDPQSCIPPGQNAWAIAPSKAAAIQAVGYDNAPAFIPPDTVPLPDGRDAYLIGMKFGGRTAPSTLGTVCEAKKTMVGTLDDQTADYVRFDHNRCN